MPVTISAASVRSESLRPGTISSAWSAAVCARTFGAGEDFDNYPRTLESDSGMLDAAGVDLLFAPPLEVMYPKPQAEQTRVEVPGISGLLCGACRPGHFVGVATVVCKLFNMVQPDIALFGNKDFQQLMVIRRMVEDLAMPVRVVGMSMPPGCRTRSRACMSLLLYWLW